MTLCTLKKPLFTLFAFGLATMFSSVAISEPPKNANHGQFHQSAAADAVVFDATADRWVSPVQFWRNYANAKGGITWGVSDQYPNYDEVNEFDTFLVQSAKGPCLMEFFHGRWRRANDVRRWDPVFNEVLGCPYVFDK